MKKRLFLFVTLTVFAGLAVFFALTVRITFVNNLNIAKDTVTETARIYAGLYENGADIRLLSQAGNYARVTVIAPDGSVLADSSPIDVNAAGNHLDRPEIKAAMNGAPAAYVRYSDTLGTDFVYYALKANGGGGYVFIRVAVPVAKINTYMRQSLPPLVLLLAAVVSLCFFLIQRVVARVLKPFSSVEEKLRGLAGGSYKPEAITGSYEEIESITRGIDDVALLLRKNIDDLKDEKNKLDYIIGNIGDGIFAADADKNITLINGAALDIFNVTPDITGKSLNYLSYEKALAAAIEDSVNSGKDSLFEITLGGRIYIVTVKKLPETPLTMVILSDVTDNRESAKRREEFFANASHELKTPLTAIKGFNELTAINNKDEGIKKYIDGITRETDRMLSLIGDMLKLSELENARTVSFSAVSLRKIADEARETLSSVIEEKSLVFEISGEGEVEAEPKHVYEIIKNLAENAVRYNNRGGRVSVTIESDKKSARLFVSDSGIGISPEEQTRIFERFYRVEKSRSGRSGGTGLGLSIVKHICAMYGWRLSLKSKLGVGTEVTVEFERGII
ncbi:MAG: hypothetical protein LBI38_05620 [Oscillospiraceae bacterium]|jgi:two-component system phosphate regulon sensor histidine kinase PhoR|nr:hypothetical protein [Oscillospiraceae bacterium]